MQVDLNCDMGESYGPYTIGNDQGMMQYISSANIACGWHGGDPVVMDRTVKIAVERDVAVGAHPSLPDLMGFGRRAMTCSAEEVENYVLYQLGALWAFAKAHKTEVRHFKQHGAWGNMVQRDLELARALCKGVARFSKEIIIVSSVGSHMAGAAEELGLKSAINMATDRAYDASGKIVPRRQPGSVIHDPRNIVERAVQMVRDGTVQAITGETVKVRVDTIAVHGDNPAALQATIDLVEAFKAAGIKIRPLAEFL